MHTLKCRNVNDAFLRGMDLLDSHGHIEKTRNGEVITVEDPVTTVYANPRERVLFDPDRDANPFFHFMEGLWMLAGFNDLATMEYYNKGMSRYSDDGDTLWGAYGWRWRSYFKDPKFKDFAGKDQIRIIIDRLKNDPYDRRCVLQMWDAVGDLGRDGADVPCNTAIYFKTVHIDGYSPRLDMTVSNRSNDIIWGAYGANVVHMSMLHEFVAAATGIRMGKYYQVSNNYHAYLNVYEPMREKLLQIDSFDYYTIKLLINHNPYKLDEVNPYPMVSVGFQDWEFDLIMFFTRKPFEQLEFNDPFFSEVAAPIQDAWYLSKKNMKEEALIEIQHCKADDWMEACFRWLSRRIK